MPAFLSKIPWAAIFLGLVFWVAGAAKMGQPELTFAGIQQYQLLDANLAYALAEGLPWLEIALGLALWLPGSRRIAVWAAGAIQLLFLAALVQALLRGLEITCACFGAPLGQNLSLLAQETALLALSVLAIWREEKIARK